MPPDLSSFTERLVRSIKGERLDRAIFIGQVSLHRAVSRYARNPWA
jgi:hypothetical protein